MAGEEKVVIDGVEVAIGGDVIIGVNGHPVKGFNDLVVYLEYHTHPGDMVNLDIIRDGKNMSMEVKLGERPLPEPS